MEIETLIETITKVVGCSPTSHNPMESLKKIPAQRILCYIAKNDYDICKEAAKAMRKHLASCETIAEAVSEMIHQGDDIIRPMNKVRKKLGLQRLLSDQEIQEIEEKKRRLERQRIVRSHKNAKQIFFIKYTDEDERLMQDAIKASNEYFEKISRIGRPPISDGMVFVSSPNRPSQKKPKRGWYKG